MKNTNTTTEEQARAAFRAAGLDNYTLRTVKGIWVATYRAPSFSITGRLSRGPMMNNYAALRRDGTTTLGVHDLLRCHLFDALAHAI